MLTALFTSLTCFFPSNQSHPRFMSDLCSSQDLQRSIELHRRGIPTQHPPALTEEMTDESPLKARQSLISHDLYEGDDEEDGRLPKRLKII